MITQVAIATLFKDSTVEILVMHYVHKGILDENLDGTHEFPIPCLRILLANDRML